MIIIGRPINGIPVNGLEYVLDDDGNTMLFGDEDKAKGFLMEHGYSGDEIEYLLDAAVLVFEELETINLLEGGETMSLYNMVNGFNPACMFLMPMLGRKQEEYPRFRDCFLSDDEERIVIYTRVGGNNRNCGYGEEELYTDPNFVKTYDDSFDSTYGYYEFNPPERWKDDFDRLVSGKVKDVSDEYVEYVKEFFPLLAEKGVVDVMFGRDGGS